METRLSDALAKQGKRRLTGSHEGVRFEQGVCVDVQRQPQ